MLSSWLNRRRAFLNYIGVIGNGTCEIIDRPDDAYFFFLLFSFFSYEFDENDAMVDDVGHKRHVATKRYEENPQVSN